FLERIGQDAGAPRADNNGLGMELRSPSASSLMLQSEEQAISTHKPDIETSSADYASRFAGPAGRYLLEVQARSIEAALQGLTPGTALDVGGAHGQLVQLLERRGWQPTVHGTDGV